MAEVDVLDGFKAEAARVGVTGGLMLSKPNDPLPVGMGKFDDTYHKNLGYISDEGVEEGRDEDKQEWIPWQENTAIRSEITKSVVTLKFVLWQSTKLVAGFYFGVKPEDIVENADGSWQFDEKGKPDLVRHQLVLDVKDKAYARRIVLASAQVSERGAIKYASAEMIGYEVTVTAYPGPNGWSVRRIYKEWDETDEGTPSPVMKTVTYPAGTSGGTSAWEFGGQDAGDLAYNATAATVQGALTALPNVGAGKITVTGNAGGPYTVVIDGSLSGTLAVDGALLTGGTGSVTVL